MADLDVAAFQELAALNFNVIPVTRHAPARPGDAGIAVPTLRRGARHLPTRERSPRRRDGALLVHRPRPALARHDASRAHGRRWPRGDAERARPTARRLARTAVALSRLSAERLARFLRRRGGFRHVRLRATSGATATKRCRFAVARRRLLLPRGGLDL